MGKITLLFVLRIQGVKFLSGVSGHGFIKIHATLPSSGCAQVCARRGRVCVYKVL